MLELEDCDLRGFDVGGEAVNFVLLAFEGDLEFGVFALEVYDFGDRDCDLWYFFGRDALHCGVHWTTREGVVRKNVVPNLGQRDGERIKGYSACRSGCGRV